MKTAKTAFSSRLFALTQADKQPVQFAHLALDIFRHQAKHNVTYSDYVQALGCMPEKVNQLSDIPFLPISLYRKKRIQTGNWLPVARFYSSGTTDHSPSVHYIDDLSFYEKVSQTIFEACYGALSGAVILALLPDYLSRPHSSLIHMLTAFMQRSGHPDCGFFMHDQRQLATRIRDVAHYTGVKQLWGSPHALLALAAQHPTLPLHDFTLIETGGIKKHAAQTTKKDMYVRLQEQLRPKALHSEYGMTELLSQAYAQDGHLFVPPPWMRLFVRDIEDPLQPLAAGQVGVLNIIDLAAMHSCAFIATDDMGCVHTDGRFELMGRVPTALHRGCHFLYGD